MGRPEHSSYSSLLGTMPSFKYCALRYWRRGSVCVSAMFSEIPQQSGSPFRLRYRHSSKKLCRTSKCLLCVCPDAFCVHTSSAKPLLSAARRKAKLCHAFVFHHVLEDHIIDRISYNCHRLVLHSLVLLDIAKVLVLHENCNRGKENLMTHFYYSATSRTQRA